MSNVLLALDPSTNCTGWAVFHDSVLVESGSLPANTKDDRWARQKTILDKLSLMLDSELDIYKVDVNESAGYTVVSEEPMIQGRNGLAIHKFLGALERVFSVPINYIHPSTVKKVMGSGKLDKLEVALAAGRLLKTSEEQDKIAELISEEDFDATDAIAIGLCFIEMKKDGYGN